MIVSIHKQPPWECHSDQVSVVDLQEYEWGQRSIALTQVAAEAEPNQHRKAAEDAHLDSSDSF